MALSQDDLNAIANAQAQYPLLGQEGISLLGIANLESSGTSNPDTAVSSSGATGLFQILPSTASNPGYGVNSLQTGQLDNPTASANFAAQYINNLIATGLTPAQAIQQYSGGNYTLSQVQQAAGNTGLSNNMVGIIGGGVNQTYQGSTGNTPIIQQAQQAATGTYAWIVELVERGGIVIVGVAILIVGLVFMLEQSKTTSVPFHALASLPEAV